MYQNFIALMDSSCLFFNKHQFEMDPLSQAQQKSMMFNNHLLMAQKNFSDRELEMKNSDNELMMMAMQQAQIQQKYKQLKDSPDGQIETQQSIDNQILIVPNRQPTLYFRVIKNKAEVYEIITMAFHRKKRWNELPHGVDLRHSWNLLWSWSKSKIDHNKLLSWQRINHFQQSKNVSRKDFLKKNIERIQKLSSKCASVFNIMPATFVLPKQYVNFVEQYTRYSEYEGEYNFWIVKPCAMSRGRGISLINDISVSYVDPVIVQKYVRNPLLLSGFKFDLRIYVVVTSVNPLQIFIYKEGFARFSTKPYSISPEDIKNKFIHLTNSSVNKNNNYSELDQTDQLYGGTKIDLKTLKDRLQAKKISWDKIWTQVCQIVVKSFAACQTDIPYNPSCFELFGYDIIIDDNLKCWLIEINSSPSLGRMNLLDDMVKQRLIDDTIDLVECVDFDRKRLVEVLERRIAQEGRATGPTFGGIKQMNRDLTYILNGTVPRKYGEMPRFLGNFQRIAPTPYSQKIIRLIGGQKMFGSQSKVLVQDKIERSDSKMSLGG